jgi:type IV fimbrial biogenesis protein FimT
MEKVWRSQSIRLGRWSMRPRGFTLVELMITIAVAAILLGLGVPSFIEMTVRNRLVTYNNDFIASVNYARSEAIRRGTPVSVCKSSNGTGCGGTWSDGWIVFVNTDDDSPAAVDAGPPAEPILRVHEALAGGYTLDANNNFENYVTYRADGSANNIGTFVVCHNGETVGARSVTLTRLRPRVGKDTNGNGIPEKTESSALTDISDCTDP